MNILTVKDILKVSDGNLICGNIEDECYNFCRDTRAIEKGDIYVGIKGENFDGNILYKEALEKGAKGCILQGIAITEDEKQEYEKNNKVIILVEDTIKAIAKLATYKRSLYNIPVVAITGSVGKTSTKDIIASVVGKKYKVLKTQGNMNNHIGLPFTILGLKDHEALVTEMGMNHFGEIRTLTQIAKPSIVVITNIGTSHIGNLGSRENILKAKLEILEGLSSNGVVIINNDNDLLHKWNQEDRTVKKVTYGIEENSDFKASKIEINELGSSFTIERQEENYVVQVPISGKHFVYNSLAAIAVGKELDIPIEDILKGIKEFELTKNRMDVQKVNISGKNITIINDAYNASYDSMKASLEYLREIPGDRKIAVLGDMLELGEYAENLHRAVGEEVAKNKIDILIVVGELAKNIAKEAKLQGMQEENIFCFNTRQEAVEKIKQLEAMGDVYLLKASNGMKFFEITEEMKR